MNASHLAGPLVGLRVVELAGMGPGPFAAMLLADMGAEVIQIERPTLNGGSVPPEQDVLRRSRASAAIDLRTPRGVAAVLDMVSSADVLIEGFRPGVAERLGIGPDVCHERNPKLIYARMTGWGQEGPLSDTAGHDITYLARTGALHAMGRAGQEPAIPLNLVGDFGGGSLYLVMGILAAVYEAERSGRGQVVDAAIVDGAASLTSALYGMMSAGMWRDERGVNLLDSGVPWYDVYQTSDGKHVAVGAIEPKFFAELVRVLGLDLGEQDRRDASKWPVMRRQIADRLITRTRDEWTRIFEHTDACVSPVLSLTEARRDPHLSARGSFLEVNGIAQPAPAPRFSRTPAAVQSPPAGLGHDTRHTLQHWGVSGIDELLADGIAVQR
jgi:alpha-methylacyl-CoA racemase